MNTNVEFATWEKIVVDPSTYYKFEAYQTKKIGKLTSL